VTLNFSGPSTLEGRYKEVMAKEGYRKVHVYQCPCGYGYEPEKGCREAGVEPGVPFEALPDQLTCPRCQRAKIHFREKRFSVKA
jgi:rubredoxin